MELKLVQKKILCAINAYPHYNDRQIAEVLGMNRSTVTAARHLFQKNKLYRTYIFPDFKKLGTKVIAVKYGDYDKYIPISYKKRMELAPPEIRIKENVFTVSSEFKGFSLFYAPDLYPIKEKIDAWNALFESIDPGVQIRDIYIPQPMVAAFKFLDLPECLAAALGVEPLPHLPGKAVKGKPLSQKEKQVLLSWVEKPLAANAQLARKAGVSRAVTGAIKKRLLDLGTVRIIHLPDWPKLGLNLGVLIYLRLKPLGSSLIEEIARFPEIVFLLSSPYEMIFFAVFSDYDQYHRRFFPKLEKLKLEKHFTAQPKELLFPLAESKFTINAHSLLKEVFGGKGIT